MIVSNDSPLLRMISANSCCSLVNVVSRSRPLMPITSRYLFTAGVPDPDLIIRTSGELRVSNFLIWQAAYSEWYVTPTYWPDFDKEEYRRALETLAWQSESPHD